MEMKKKVGDKVTMKSQKLFSCVTCQKTFSTRRALKTHESIHNDEKPFCCSFCDKKFAQAVNLQMHERVHTSDRPFSCSKCDKKFSQPSNLKIHEMMVHTSEKPFSCSQCDYTCTSSGNLKTHERIHTSDKAFSYSKCAKKFTPSSVLRKHERIHTAGENPISCEWCDKKYNRFDALRDHQKIHTNKKQFSCSICDKKFARLLNLRTHERTHTQEKPFSCLVCGKIFSESGSLKTHERNHSDEKPFSCSKCDYKCTTSGSLKTHERIHTDEKPFSCSKCEKKFSDGSVWKRHERIHNGERPRCDKKLSRTGNLLFLGLPLQNPNTTCFMNAAINSLAGCDMVRQILTTPQITDSSDFYQLLINQLPVKNKSPQTPESMRESVKHIFTSLSNILLSRVSSAVDLRTKFSKIFWQFRTGQHDSTEFILKLAWINSLLGDLFKFTVEEKKSCRTCGNEEKIGAEGNIDIEMRNCLNIMPTPHPTDIQSLIDSHLESEERVGENKMECSHCKTRENADVTKQVGTPPSVLAVRVSRDAIQFGHEFAPNVPVTPNETIVFKNTSYRVKSIIEHLGGNLKKPLKSGHYIAYLNKNSKWIKCDDRKISEQASAPQKGLLFLYETADIQMKYIPKLKFKDQ